MKFHLMSDLHLEFNSQDIRSIDSLVRHTVDVSDITLLLAGDIGHPWVEAYWVFLIGCASRYKHVIFITGNHEYYNKKMVYSDIDKLITDRTKPSNLHFLNNSKIVIDGVTILGSTMWSHIPKASRYEVSESMNDYNFIMTNTTKPLAPGLLGSTSDLSTKPKFITVDDVNDLHTESIKWLKSAVDDEPADSKIIVMTHHLPTFALIHEQYKKYSKMNSAFASDLSRSGIFCSKIKYWVCGHTHNSMEHIDNSTGIHFLINPFGYEGENEQFNVKEFEIVN